MNKRLSLLAFYLISLSVVSSVTVLAESAVGVKEGDWIEYTITYTGSPATQFPEWIRIEIKNVQGTGITADVIVERLDGSSNTSSGTFDLDIGVPDLLAISANLDTGDEFYHEDYGNTVIAGTEDETYAGAKRTVVYATVNRIELRWDKATGILLQSDQSTDNFTQNLRVDKTNLWQTQIFGLDPTLFYVAVVGIIVIIAFVTFSLIRRRK